MTLSDYLKEARLSQMEFARRIGVTQGAVGFWIHNGRITIERAIQIEKATEGKVTCEELCPSIDWPYLRRLIDDCQKEAA